MNIQTGVYVNRAQILLLFFHLLHQLTLHLGFRCRWAAHLTPFRDSRSVAELHLWISFRQLAKAMLKLVESVFELLVLGVESGVITFHILEFLLFGREFVLCLLLDELVLLQKVGNALAQVGRGGVGSHVVLSLCLLNSQLFLELTGFSTQLFDLGKMESFLLFEASDPVFSISQFKLYFLDLEVLFVTVLLRLQELNLEPLASVL